MMPIFIPLNGGKIKKSSKKATKKLLLEKNKKPTKKAINKTKKSKK